MRNSDKSVFLLIFGLFMPSIFVLFNLPIYLGIILGGGMMIVSTIYYCKSVDELMVIPDKTWEYNNLEKDLKVIDEMRRDL